MQFVRTIVESSRLEELVAIPKEFKNQKVEVLILPLTKKHEKKKKTFNPDDFERILNIDPEIVDRELKNMRDEWERL